MNHPNFFSGVVQNMKSAAKTTPALEDSPFAMVHSGPRPIMYSAVSDRSNGFLNTASISHSEWPGRNSFEPPISTSSHSLIKVNSTAADGPLLKARSEKLHSPAGPIEKTASGSLLSSASAPLADNINTIAH